MKSPTSKSSVFRAAYLAVLCLGFTAGSALATSDNAEYLAPNGTDTNGNSVSVTNGNGDYVKYKIQYLGKTVGTSSTTFTYSVTSYSSQTTPGISHWDIVPAFCDLAAQSTALTSNDSVGGWGLDGSTNQTGFKFGTGYASGGETRTVTLTLPGTNWNVGSVSVVVKCGNLWTTGTVQGPVCSSEIPPPSLSISAVDKTVCAVGRNGAIVNYTYTVNGGVGTVQVTASKDSGTVFSGQTLVTLTATDSANNTSTCSFTVTVLSAADGQCSNDNDPLHNNIALSDCHKAYTLADFDTALGLTGSYYLLTNSGLQSVVFPYEPAFGATPTTVYFTATSNQGPVTGSIELTNNDTAAPVITVTQSDVTHDSCNPAVSFGITATDCSEITYAYTITGGLLDGTSITSGYVFPLGTTKVTATATDPYSQSSSTTFNVTITQAMGTVTVNKFYDFNGNGVQDAGEPAINGFKIQIGSDVQYTIAGQATFSLPVGSSYTVTEIAPGASIIGGQTFAWESTTGGTSASVSLSCESRSASVTFGNRLVSHSGGLTLGFWSNKNGQALESNIGALVGLSLRNANGTDFDPATPAAFAKWLTSASATNMANMLSAQMAAMFENVNIRPNSFGGVNGSSYIKISTDIVSSGWIQVSDLLARANTSLGTDPVTVASGATRSYQEKLKTALDDGNNNRTLFVQAPVSSVTY